MFSSEQFVELSSNLKSLMAPICRKYKLSFSQFLILSNIPLAGISLKSLSIVVGSEISTMSRNVDKLLDIDLVTKTKDSLDKRKVIILRTEKAVDICTVVHKRIKLKIKHLKFNDDDDFNLIVLKNAIEEFSWVFYKYLHEK